MTAELMKKNMELDSTCKRLQTQIDELTLGYGNARRSVSSLIRIIAGKEADGYGFDNHVDDALDELTELVLSVDWGKYSEEKEMIFAEVINICFKERG